MTMGHWLADVHLAVQIAIMDCSRIHFVAGRGVNAPENGTYCETVSINTHNLVVRLPTFRPGLFIFN